ncbi:acyl-CoA dehydrogenase family protein [Hymenobacter cheonanensis]|uniref:acyl-CoA dehydrogenase family protein n=1 Tax=Hymenobacter sp. CA2-7 TaxID=3063993 RepID=UPI002713CF1A|nr:acyl-CoA dehydrogenase family protein [Hymenobacter sp. CA2-7]MDO7885297.1 acyl-CoA dehydrogenase family protein [Hymenobacter sp. CA2-7]
MRPLPLLLMIDFSPTTRPAAPAAAETPTLSSLPATPASCAAAAAQLAPRLLAQAAATDEVGGFPTQEMRWLHEAGLLTAVLPTSLGGAGLGEPAATLLLYQALYHVGRGNLAVGRLWEGHVNALLLIRCFGSPAQLARAAADARAGHIFGVWNTENPANGVQLEPVPGAPGRYRLRGAKTFASGAGHITRPVLTGALRPAPAPVRRLDQGPLPVASPAVAPTGWQLVLLRADEQPPVLDRSFWRPLGMRATASFQADFTGIQVGPDDLVGQPNDYYRAPWFGGGAARFAAVQLGGAAAVFDETRRFLRRLGRTDDPYQRQRLGEMLALHETGQRWLRGAAEHAALPPTPTELPPPRLEALAAYVNTLRATTEDICLQTLRLAERSVGARGLLQPEPFERLHRDLTHYLRQPAPDATVADAGRFALASDKPAYQLF